MKLTEVKILKEEIQKKQLKEMFPTATDAQIDYALNEAPNFAGAVKTLGNLTKKGAQAALATGKKAVKTAAPIVKKGAQAAMATGKKVADKTTKVAKQVGKDVGKGYKNIKQVGAKAVGVASKALDQMDKDMAPGDDQAQAKAQNQQLRKSTNRLKSMTGLKSPAIAAQALQRAANGEVLKPNERKEVAPILQALATAMNSGTGTQRIISLIQQTKAK